MTKEPLTLIDGQASFEGGIDSGKPPTLATDSNPGGLKRNQLSFAINTTMRGGRLKPRPGFRKIEITGLQLTQSLFQGAKIFNADNDPGCIIASIGGHIHRFNVGRDNSVVDITIDGDPNPALLPQVWMEQAENFFIIQDNQSKPLIYNGGELRRAKNNEVPTGNVIAYGMGRLWQALPGGTTFVAGDIVYGPTGTASQGLRDAMLTFTENTFLNEGGAFTVPSNAGEIRAMVFPMNLDTSQGQGPLQVFTANSVFSVNAPTDRTIWKAVTYPIQTVSMVTYGALNHNATVLVNGDVFYRSPDGVRSFVIARRDFGQWGNTPISKEMNRVIERDDRNLLGFGSAVVFDNRLLMTCSPVPSVSGTYHRALMSLDLDLISSMGQKFPPAWEGIWTGLNVLQILKGTIGGIERCFLFARNADGEIELWELTLNERFDLVPEEKRIVWAQEYPSFPCGDQFGLKRLETGDIWIDRVAGQVDFELMYRPDQNPCWLPWDNWGECAAYQDCDIAECYTPKSFKEQYRAKKKFNQPPDTCNAVPGIPARDGYEFQPRLQVTGFCEIKQMRVKAKVRQESPYGGCST